MNGFGKEKLVKTKDLNPIWNEKLVFHIKVIVDLPYRVVEVNVFNERRSSNNMNFIGKVRVSGSSIAKEGEEGPQMYTLDKRNLFSHIRGEINLKLYVSTREQVKQVRVDDNGMMVSGSAPFSSSGFSKKKKVHQQNHALLVQQQRLVQENKPTMQGQNNAKPVEPSPGPISPITASVGGVAGGASDGRYFIFRWWCEIVAEVKIRNYRDVTKRASSNHVEWDQVFAFSKDCIQSSMVEVFVKECNKDDYLGRVRFDLNEVPRRVPSDSPLAPQRYRMEDKK
ncbi:hypothetical protein V6N11_010450 [Hibiscus sabdariffa]|uniref:C2 domain-containing protein n=1 Tax=Hibiscus sabdariffa TaxID=183260 RepID=A0ABR2S5B7_9ROSI